MMNNFRLITKFALSNSSSLLNKSKPILVRRFLTAQPAVKYVVPYEQRYQHPEMDFTIKVVAEHEPNDDPNEVTVYCPQRFARIITVNYNQQAGQDIIQQWIDKWMSGHPLKKKFEDLSRNLWHSAYYNDLDDLERRVFGIKFLTTYVLFDDYFETLFESEKYHQEGLKLNQTIINIFNQRPILDLKLDDKYLQDTYKLYCGLYTDLCSDAKQLMRPEVFKLWQDDGRKSYLGFKLEGEIIGKAIKSNSYVTPQEYIEIRRYSGINMLVLPMFTDDRLRLDTYNSCDAIYSLIAQYACYCNDILSYPKERFDLSPLNPVQRLVKQGRGIREAMTIMAGECSRLMATIETVYENAPLDQKPFIEMHARLATQEFPYLLVNMHRFGWTPIQ